MAQALAVRHSNKGGATQVQVFRNNNGTLAAFGNPYTPAALLTDSGGTGKQNLACQFGQYFYCSAGRELRRYNPSTQNWDLEVAVYTVSADNCAGLYVGRGPTGAPRLIVVYRNISNQLASRTLDTPGGTWSAEVSTGLGVTTADWPRTGGIKFNNEVLLGARGSVCALRIDTLSASVQSVASGVTLQAHPYSFTKVGSRLFALAWPSTIFSTWLNIYERVNGSWSAVLLGSTNGMMPRFGNYSSSNCSVATMFYDEASASLIVQAWQDGATAAGMGTPGTGPTNTNPGGNGLICIQVPVATFTEVNLIGAVVPAAVAVPGGPDPNLDARGVVEVDTGTDPTSPAVYPWWCISNTVWQRYQWNGVASPMSILGTGGDRGIALSHNPNGGGEYFVDPSTTASPTYHLEEVQARVPIVNGTRVFLRGYIIDETGGTPTATDETVGLYWGTTQQTPDNLATISNAVKLSGPGTAPSIVANKITNFTFDNTTIYSVDWDAVGSDGLANQQQHMLMPHVEV